MYALNLPHARAHTHSDSQTLAAEEKQLKKLRKQAYLAKDNADDQSKKVQRLKAQHAKLEAESAAQEVNAQLVAGANAAAAISNEPRLEVTLDGGNYKKKF